VGLIAIELLQLTRALRERLKEMHDTSLDGFIIAVICLYFYRILLQIISCKIIYCKLILSKGLAIN
jgi:hypothetical protein